MSKKKYQFDHLCDRMSDINIKFNYESNIYYGVLDDEINEPPNGLIFNYFSWLYEAVINNDYE
jgi:hypothetical protein